MWEMYLREAENQHDDKYSAVILLGDTEDDARNSCVYGVGVNHMTKRITVWFRGTVIWMMAMVGLHGVRILIQLCA